MRTPLENVRNQTLANLLRSLKGPYKVQKLSNVCALFYALTGFLKLNENLTRLETSKPVF